MARSRCKLNFKYRFPSSLSSLDLNLSLNEPLSKDDELICLQPSMSGVSIQVFLGDSLFYKNDINYLACLIHEMIPENLTWAMLFF